MRLIVLSLILVILGITILSLLPPRSGIEIPGNDKVGHFIAYAVLTINAGLLLDRKKWLVMLFVCALYGLLLEYLQGFVPGRSVTIYDVYANTLGVLIGWLILFTFKETILRLLRRIKLIN